jgi:uncharacterized protein
MMYIVIAKDGTDSEAPARRQKVRTEHLEKVQSSVDSGFLLLGGALLNKEGGMMGSAMLLEATSEEEVWTFLKNDIYSQGNVWQHFEVYPFRKTVQSPALSQVTA